MSIAKVGINQIGIAKKGTFATSPTNITLIGLKPPGTLKITGLDGGDDGFGRPLLNKTNFAISCATHQPSMLKLDDAINQYCADGGADVELLAKPQTTGVTGGCFQLAGATQNMGVKFEYLFSSKERRMNYDLEVALPYADAKTLIDGADAATPESLGADYGVDRSKQRYPYLATFTIGGSAVFANNEIKSYLCRITGDGDKSELDNRTTVDWFEIYLEIVGKGATISEIVAAMTAAQSNAAIVFQETTATSTFEKLSIAAGVLHEEHPDITIGDSERIMKRVLRGKVTGSQFAFAYTAPDGGGTSADGSEGGTCTISL